MKYKVIEEYKKFYVAINDLGFKECFLKAQYQKSKDGYIIKKRPNPFTKGYCGMVHDKYEEESENNE